MSTTPSMALRKTDNTAVNNGLFGGIMNEKIYKVMGGAGALNIAFGVISIVVGLATGALLIISGGKLLSGRRNIII